MSVNKLLRDEEGCTVADEYKKRLSPEQQAFVLDPTHTLEQIMTHLKLGSTATAMRVRQRVAEGEGWYCDEHYPSRQPRSGLTGRAAANAMSPVSPPPQPVTGGPPAAPAPAASQLIAWYGPSVHVRPAQDEALQRLYPGSKRVYMGIAGNAASVRRQLEEMLAHDCVAVAPENVLERVVSDEGVLPLRPNMQQIGRVENPQTDMEWDGKIWRFKGFQRIQRLGTEYAPEPVSPAKNVKGVRRLRWIAKEHSLSDEMYAQLRAIYGPSFDVVEDGQHIADDNDLLRRARTADEVILVGALRMYQILTAQEIPVLRPIRGDQGKVTLRRVIGVQRQFQDNPVARTEPYGQP
jgi:hypothetical protein